MPHVILFVDDEPEVLALLRRTFPESEGYETLTAPGGAEALAILASRPVELLVTDQRMPEMTGVELIAQARRRSPDLCAILLTAYTDPRDIVDAINRGEVYRYLVKPWESADLRQTVIRALEQVSLKARARADRRSSSSGGSSRCRPPPSSRETSASRGATRRCSSGCSTASREVVPCDVAAALVATPGAATVLLIRAVGALSEPRSAP